MDAANKKKLLLSLGDNKFVKKDKMGDKTRGRIWKKIKKSFCHPNLFLLFLLNKTARLFPDKLFLKLKFRLMLGRKLDLKNPKTFNEKLQWLKLYNRNPEYTTMVDKYAVKQYVADKIGEEYVIPTLGVWEKPEDIDWDALPNQFVLKTTHGGGGGGIVICKDKASFDIELAKKLLNNSLDSDIYLHYREWPYKNVPKRVIAEKYMVDESGYELKDYKVFNFNGIPYIIQLDFNRFVSHKKNLYSTDWKILPFSFNYPSSPEISFDKPKKLERMLELASYLSKGHPFLRTDFYVINDELYFGELTFFPASGLGLFTPEDWDFKLGELIKL